MKKTSIIAPTFGLVLLCGCTFGAPQADSSSPTSPTSTPSSAPTSDTSSASSPSSSSSSPRSVVAHRFGSGAGWADGVDVSVGEPQPFKPSDTASGTKSFKQFVVIEITIRNGSRSALQSYDVNTTVTTGGETTKRVFDSAQGITYNGGSILPGKSLTLREVYGVDAKHDVTVRVDKNSGDPSLYFMR